MADSLKYSRGSLAVLDQLLLPHQTVYVNVAGVNDAWAVIRSMQVRGAPLIAIVAVLGLAAELDTRRVEFGASKLKLGQFLHDSINYLRTSRPTAVNLFNAMDELDTLLAQTQDDDTISADQVIDRFIETAEALWKEDISLNRSIGFHGANKILELVKRDKIRVLTICNTGSLATAGYGTALGVVRALHELGKLEQVYACETRPYNQGARLTAYEIVQDKLPGTLITDNMASALMAVKGVDVVVVGADRVAGNGDTANKIGTYQLAIAAKYHRIPFFTALPTSTIDVSMASGLEIHVEERPASELLLLNGVKIAPDGIDVWNPAFDVTPCALITGIITELGVIMPETATPSTSTSSQNTDTIIPVAKFLQLHAAESRQKIAIEARLTKAAVPISAPTGYLRMDSEHIAAYIATQGTLTSLLNLTSEEVKDIQNTLKITEVGDGNLNFVYIVEGPRIDNIKIIIKQALPYVRCVGENWPLTLQRAYFEYKALVVEREMTGGKFVPEVYHFDYAKSLIAMRYVETPHIILRKALISSMKVTSFACDLGEFIARTLFGTSALNLSGGVLRKGVAEWSENVAMCALTEKVIFTDPYMDSPLNRWTTPHLDHVVASIRADSQFKLAIAHFKQLFLTSTQALLHGDLHTGSVMVKEGSTFVIDPEFAFYGPMGFDLGAVLSNLYLSYFSHTIHPANESDYAEWVLAQIERFYKHFETVFLTLWQDKITTTQGSGELYVSGVYTVQELETAKGLFMKSLWRDTLGFTAAKMIRRVVGIAHVEDLESIEDLSLRSLAEFRSLTFARRVIFAAYEGGGRGGVVSGVADVVEANAIAEMIAKTIDKVA